MMVDNLVEEWLTGESVLWLCKVCAAVEPDCERSAGFKEGVEALEGREGVEEGKGQSAGDQVGRTCFARVF